MTLVSRHNAHTLRAAGKQPCEDVRIMRTWVWSELKCICTLLGPRTFCGLEGRERLGVEGLKYMRQCQYTLVGHVGG